MTTETAVKRLIEVCRNPERFTRLRECEKYIPTDEIDGDRDAYCEIHRSSNEFNGGMNGIEIALLIRLGYRELALKGLGDKSA